ncbi:MAG TPA: methyltransferase domain-containing protein [Caulobacteraceae bacterium]|nr:methyltransferase domain-containing protein [Caulobacteraceae bacterium]
MTDTELQILRRAYARHVYFASRADDPRLEAAFAETPREAFMGAGPWRMPGIGFTYHPTPDDDPHWLYQDALVGLMPEKGLNNGQPSFLAFLIGLGRAKTGEHVVHIGAGVGYYTAIFARLVGETGRVTAIEYEPALAARAASNLAGYPQVRCLEGDGSKLPLDAADVILVNAGAARPLDLWLDTLKPGGRLILPLCVLSKLPDGTPMTRGGIFLIERDAAGFAAAYKSTTGIYPCFGASDPDSEASLTEAFRRGGMEKVRRLHRTDNVPPDARWVSGPGWALTYE